MVTGRAWCPTSCWGPLAETAFRALGRQGPGEDTADIKHVQIGALAGAEAAVPSSVLRSRKLTISGSGAGSVPAADIKAQIPAYIQLIAGRIWKARSAGGWVRICPSRTGMKSRPTGGPAASCSDTSFPAGMSRSAGPMRWAHLKS